MNSLQMALYLYCEMLEKECTVQIEEFLKGKYRNSSKKKGVSNV